MRELTEEEKAEVYTVQISRAFTDPVLSYRNETRERGPTAFDDIIPLARLALVNDLEAGERVVKASLPEVARYCSGASLVNANWARGEVAKVYMYAFVQTLNEWFSEEERVAILSQFNFDEEGVELSVMEKRKLEKLRKHLRAQQDRVFLEEQYEEMNVDVPRWFWKTREHAPVLSG